VNKINSLLPIKNQKEENKLTFTSNPNPKLRRKTMSNINNNGASMNKIELSPHLQEISCENAAVIQGGAIVTLYNDINYGGDALGSDTEISDLSFTAYNDQASSIYITQGTWAFYTDANYQGSSVVLNPGAYNWVENVGLPNDTISSFRRVG
jgi:Beta/Gamma crystallin